jgi:chorismate mutase/prephenate dehydratase
MKRGRSSPVVVSYQGVAGSFSHLAALKYFKNRENVSFQPTVNLKEVFHTLSSESSVYGVIPIESSTNGTIHGVYDRLLSSEGSIKILAEISAIEKHCLCIPRATGDTKSSNDLEIDKIFCHPHILECCSDFLDELDCRRQKLGKSAIQRIASVDSASACANVEIGNAAIGSQEAAELYNLDIVSTCIGNDKNAETRYLIVARNTSSDKASEDDPLDIGNFSSGSQRQSHPWKASMAVALKNVPGAIFKMSSCFAFRNMDIIKVESRPASTMKRAMVSESRPFTQRHWDLIFYIDYEPSCETEVNEALVKNLNEYCFWVRELGQYKSSLNDLDNVPSEWTQIMDLVSR